MPIFEYQCQACGHQFDALQKIGEGALRKCPECGKLKLRKLLSAPSFHLKGSGWYQTDFKGKGKKSEGEEGGAKAGKGHALDSDKAHSHDHGHDHGHSHGSGGHSHSHGGKTHSHGSGGSHSH